jgi:hypothetical protein
MRYLCLTQVMVLRDIAISVRKRFPNMDSLVDAGWTFFLNWGGGGEDSHPPPPPGQGVRSFFNKKKKLKKHSGFLMEHEKSLIDNEKSGIQKYWMPINWVFNLCYDMRAKDKIIGDVLLNGVLQVR